MTRLLAATFVFCAPLLAMLLAVPPAPACAPAYASGKQVAIATETAIIVWDEKSKTQHFIRRAAFYTDADDFGFLVPTPTRPEIGEANDEAFRQLEDVTAPRMVTQKVRASDKGLFNKRSAAGSAVPGSVSVLETKRVAGQDIAVLAATDAKLLTEWLQQHGYATRPALTEWLEPYIKLGWILTASKIAKDPQMAGVSTKAVRMSFHTERPFYPYREPADAGTTKQTAFSGQRLLRVYFIGTHRVEGRLGDEPAPGMTTYANALTAERRTTLMTELGLSDKVPEAWWLTEIEDFTTPRPGTDDVFYQTSLDQATVERTPVTVYVEEEDSFNRPAALGLLVGFVALFIVLAVILLVRMRAR